MIETYKQFIANIGGINFHFVSSISLKDFYLD